MMTAAYTETGRITPSSLYCEDLGTGSAACNAVFYVRKIETDHYRGIEYITVGEPFDGISDDDDAFWHLPRCAPSREPVRPPAHHSPRRSIEPIHFRHVRCMQRRREHRTRS